MAELIFAECIATDLAQLAEHEGVIALLIDPERSLDAAARRVNRLARGAVQRAIESRGFDKLDPGGTVAIGFPPGLAARAVILVKLPKRAEATLARKAGAQIAKLRGEDPALVLAGAFRRAAALAEGIALRDYKFVAHKKVDDGQQGPVRVMVSKPEVQQPLFEIARARAEGVVLTRDLVNEPANVLTTVEFAKRLGELSKLGVKVEVLDEPALEKLGMRALLAVGQGSDSPSKVVVMHWNGGGDEPPVALVGKGVVFDTGGISLKPALGMEEMTFDMGGAGTVAGVMHALARRGARANVVAAVGLVENMPDARAQRPGDVVRSMKGDTIEVVNTDAEGRLVLCDVLWHVQEKYAPAAIIDLATLTGAMIVALGHHMAGVFSNDNKLAEGFLKAASDEGEGAWRMPIDAAFDKQIKSRVADIKNTGGRPGGSVTAARFLARFIKPDMAWMHLDIAGVASLKTETDLGPAGATGWGVRALDRLIADRYEA